MTSLRGETSQKLVFKGINLCYGMTFLQEALPEIWISFARVSLSLCVSILAYIVPHPRKESTVSFSVCSHVSFVL